MARSRNVKKIEYHANVGKVIEYNGYIGNTSRDTTIQKAKRVNLRGSAVLVLTRPVFLPIQKLQNS